MATKIVQKLTVKTMGAQPKPHSVKEATDLVQMYGVIRGSEVGTSNFGDFVKFKGEFEGVNLESGEVVRSSVLILPKMLENILKDSLPTGDDVTGLNVQVAVVIGVEPSEKGNTGYAFTVKPLIEPEVSDELAGLRGLASKRVEELGIGYQPQPQAEAVAEAPKAEKKTTKKVDTAKDE